MRLEEANRARNAFVRPKPISHCAVFLRQDAQHARLRVNVFGAPPAGQRRCGGFDGLERQIGEAAFAGMLLEKVGLNGGRQVDAVAESSAKCAAASR